MSDKSNLMNTAADVVAATEEGTRARKVLTTKVFAKQADIITNIVPKGVGHKEMLGRITGIAYKSEVKVNDVQGKQIESYPLFGSFVAEIFATGELQQGSVLYLPDAFALQVRSALQLDGVTMAEIDVEIGVENTGKTIPYEWAVHSFVDGAEINALKAIRNRRQSRHSKHVATALPAPEATLQIETGTIADGAQVEIPDPTQAELAEVAHDTQAAKGGGGRRKAA